MDQGALRQDQDEEEESQRELPSPLAMEEEDVRHHSDLAAPPSASSSSSSAGPSPAGGLSSTVRQAWLPPPATPNFCLPRPSPCLTDGLLFVQMGRLLYDQAMAKERELEARDRELNEVTNR